MKYLTQIQTSDPANLETLYRQALRLNQAGEFTQDILALYAQSPENVLLTAWYHRLREPIKATRAINWALAVPLALVCGLLFWLTSDTKSLFANRYPVILLIGTPIAGLAVLAFLSLASRQRMRQAILLGLGLLAVLVYIWFVVPSIPTSAMRNYVADLMGIHMPLLAWSAVGLYLAGFRNKPPERFAFLAKSLEVFTIGGLSIIAGVIFSVVSFSLFEALQVDVPEIVTRLIVAGGAGLIPVLAVALAYDPQLPASGQEFRTSIIRFLGALLRILVIPTLLVAVIYVFFIPFNFMAPFENREVLFAYNGMLFAVMGLLLGATPLHPEDVSERQQSWLRLAILIIAGLAVLVSLYAMSAILYRTFLGGLTPNRLVVICWNIVNIVTLIVLIIRQLRPARETWIDSIKAAFAFGAAGYIACGVALVLALPLIFR
jgi:hypothetical protein